MKIGELAARDVVSVGPADSLRKAARVMVDAEVGSAVVLADGALQRYLLALRGDRDIDLSDLSNLLALLVGSWSLAVDLPPAAAALRSLSTEVYAALRDAVLAELPELQRAVHPSPGWRRR